MKFTFFEIESITAGTDNGAAYMTLHGSMSLRSQLDALAELWEYIGDEALIEHMEREGFKVERTEESSR